MNFLSLCSGIESASVALEPLGWKAVAFAEIEPFPCALLAHRYPHIPNLGDITRHHDWRSLSRALIGGPPCQGFSLAGLRKGMADPRSQLSLTYVEIAAKYRSAWLVWENVPGVLSSNGGQDFADLLAAFTGRRVRVPAGGWQNSGTIEGIAEAYGIAWRVLDAQYCGVPQRRRRVFIVGYLGDWRLAAAVLFERESLSGNSPPRRSSGQADAGTLTKSALDSSSPCGGDGREDLLVAEVAPCLDANYGRLHGCSGQDLKHGHGHLVAGTVVAKWAKGSGGPSGDECANLVTSQDITPPLTGNIHGDNASREGLLVAFNLRGREGGAVPEIDPDGLAVQRAASGGSSRSYIAFDSKASGRNGFGIGEVSPTLRAMGHKQTHHNAGGQVAIAFDSTQITSPDNRSNPGPDDPCHPLAAEAHPPAVAFTIHGTDSDGAIASESETAQCLRTKPPGMVENSSTTVAVSGTYVRRLTPRECERLQGFPDDYTLIPGWGDRPRKPKDRAETVAYLISTGWPPEEAEAIADHPDGCRYRALGNSKAIPVVRWIGARIDAVEAICLSTDR